MKGGVRTVFACTALGLLAVVAVAIGCGPGELGPLDSWGVLLSHLTGSDLDPTSSVIVLQLRLPRTLLAATLGASLALAGVVTQGLFRNSLAEPSVLGVSTAAAATAVVGFSFHLDEMALWATPALSALGAMGGLALLFALAGRARSIATLLLSGIALSSMSAALITLMLALQIERWELGLKVMGWLMGSLEARSWEHLAWSLPPMLIGAALAWWLRRDLDLLHLGQETAHSLGMRPQLTRLLAVLCVGILVGGATALAGVIGFIGLVVPHVARMLIGPSHGRLLPFSMLLGAITLVIVDALTRVTTAVVLPPGVLTSLIGAPFFLWLLRKHDGGRTA